MFKVGDKVLIVTNTAFHGEKLQSAFIEKETKTLWILNNTKRFLKTTTREYGYSNSYCIADYIIPYDDKKYKEYIKERNLSIKKNYCVANINKIKDAPEEILDIIYNNLKLIEDVTNGNHC